MERTAALLALVLTALPAAAQEDPFIGMMPFELPSIQAVPRATPPPPPVDGKPVPLPEQVQVNFQYGEINDRLKKIIIGRPLKYKGDIRQADRVDRGEIKWIVVHSAMGSCGSAINTMEVPHEAAAHFIVCKDGSVTRLVDIKNISLHVKTDRINDASVGIETETGLFKGGYAPDDWDPAAHWKMFSSLAWLIRAVAEETGVPRDWSDPQTPGIIGHLEADADHVNERGRHDGHTDPGSDFYGKVFPSLDKRFPGQGMTPQKYLMLLVTEDRPPLMGEIDEKGARLVRLEDVAKAGLAKIELFDVRSFSKGKPLKTWIPPEKGLPPAVVELPVPTANGIYVVEAYDLVGNKATGVVTVGSTTPAIATR